MQIEIRAYRNDDMPEMANIWNQVVADGIAFPQEDLLTDEGSRQLLREPNLHGRRGGCRYRQRRGALHSASEQRRPLRSYLQCVYAVRKDIRGAHIGEKLVKDCLAMAHEKGFRILQFNAVVASNVHAIHLYERLGFQKIGMVPEGFRMPDGSYEDIFLFYHTV